MRADDRLRFNVTDGTKSVGVDCLSNGFANVPDLFREGQGVVVEGVLASQGRLSGDQILAKHDERYMSREVVELLKKQGRWQGATRPRGDRRNRAFRPCPGALRRARASSSRLGVGDPDLMVLQRGADPVRAHCDRIRGAGQRASDLGLLRPQRGREFAQRGAGDLQDLRHGVDRSGHSEYAHFARLRIDFYLGHLNDMDARLKDGPSPVCASRAPSFSVFMEPMYLKGMPARLSPS